MNHYSQSETCPDLVKTINISYEALYKPDLGCCLFNAIFPADPVVKSFLCIYVALIIISLVLNVYAVLDINSEDFSCLPRFILFKNLLHSDFLFILTQTHSVITCLLVKRTLTYDSLCLAHYFFNIVSTFCSILTITCMALEQYLYNCKPMYYINKLTSKRCRLIITLIWLLSVTIAMVDVILISQWHKASLVGTYTTGLLCDLNTVENHLGVPRAVAVFHKVPLFIVIILCILSYLFSSIHINQKAQNLVQPTQHVYHRTLDTILICFFMLLFQLLPVLFTFVSEAFLEPKGTELVVSMLRDSPGWTAAGTLHIVLLVLQQVPPFINPLIFALLKQEVRQPVHRVTWRRDDVQISISQDLTNSRQTV